MAARADRILDKATIVARTVETGQTVTVGQVVKDGDADHEVQAIGAATDLAIGVVVELGKLAGAAGDVVMVALLCGGVVPVKSAGTCTRGQSAKYSTSAGCVADAVPDFSSPANSVLSPGTFTQSGASGDLVGLLLHKHYVTE